MATTRFASVVLLLSFASAALAAHIIKDNDEAHHVSAEMLGTTHRHSHDDIQRLRDDFHDFKAAHEARHGEVKPSAERFRSITDEIKRTRRDEHAKSRVEPNKKTNALRNSHDVHEASEEGQERARWHAEMEAKAQAKEDEIMLQDMPPVEKSNRVLRKKEHIERKLEREHGATQKKYSYKAMQDMEHGAREHAQRAPEHRAKEKAAVPQRATRPWLNPKPITDFEDKEEE